MASLWGVSRERAASSLSHPAEPQSLRPPRLPLLPVFLPQVGSILVMSGGPGTISRDTKTPPPPTPCLCKTVVPPVNAKSSTPCRLPDGVGRGWRSDGCLLHSFQGRFSLACQLGFSALKWASQNLQPAAVFFSQKLHLRASRLHSTGCLCQGRGRTGREGRTGQKHLLVCSQMEIIISFSPRRSPNLLQPYLHHPHAFRILIFFCPLFPLFLFLSYFFTIS